VSIDAGAAQGLAYYAATSSGVLAPRGWFCFGLYGSSGDGLFVTPQPFETDELLPPARRRFAGPIIESDSTFWQSPGRFDIARIIARVFPDQVEFAQRVIREGILAASDFPFGPYPKDRLTYRSDHIVEYQTPPHSEGLGTDSRWLTANDTPINGVIILQGEPPDAAILNVRLRSGMNRLTPYIIHQFERDNPQSVPRK